MMDTPLPRPEGADIGLWRAYNIIWYPLLTPSTVYLTAT